MEDSEAGYIPTQNIREKPASRGIKIIPKKYAGLVLGVVLSLVMGALMSFTYTFINLGFVDIFLQKWAVAFASALPVSLTLSTFVVPIVKFLVDKITQD